MSEQQEQPKQQTRRKIHRLVNSRLVLEQAGKWVDSDQIDLSEVVPLECYTVPVETIREVER